MLLFIFGVIVATFLFISFVVVCFSEGLSGYLRAKTEKLKAQTELLREKLRKEADKHERSA